MGIDFNKNRADVGLFGPNGEIISKHTPFKNSQTGYNLFKEHVLEAMKAYDLKEMNISGEATSYYWLPFFMAISKDVALNEYDLHPFLLNPKWVSWYKKCFAPTPRYKLRSLHPHSVRFSVSGVPSSTSPSIKRYLSGPKQVRPGILDYWRFFSK